MLKHSFSLWKTNKKNEYTNFNVKKSFLRAEINEVWEPYILFCAAYSSKQFSSVFCIILVRNHSDWGEFFTSSINRLFNAARKITLLSYVNESHRLLLLIMITNLEFCPEQYSCLKRNVFGIVIGPQKSLPAYQGYDKNFWMTLSLILKRSGHSTLLVKTTMY